MGVEGFKGFFYRSSQFKKCFTKKLPEKVSSLYIDCNGIFYKAAAKVYLTGDNPLDNESDRKKLMKKSKKNLEKLHFKVITEEIIKHIDTVHPEDNLIIAVDSVVNSAKMNQQKQRRFMSSLEKDPYQIFEKVSITPGTEFMKRLDKYLENWLATYEGYLPKRTIYSSHLSPGEGEHKIFDYIRRGDIVPGEGAQVIGGLDNDLIILSVVSPLRNIYMRPENGTDMVDVDKLRVEIINQMNFEGADKEAIIRDFCVVCTLLGNDFLHKFPNVFKDFSKTIPLIFKVYKWTKKHLTDKNNNIIWKNYLNFLRGYDTYNMKKEPLFVQVYLNPPKFPYKEIEDNIIVRNEDGNRVNQVYDKSKHTLSFNYNKFSREWYQKQFNDKIIQWDGEILKTYNKELIFNMCMNYLQTVQWVQYYYTKGYKYVSNLHSYHYLYNPLIGSVTTTLRDLINANETSVLTDIKKKEDEIPITPVHQLLSVISKKNLDLIPEEYHSLYSNFLEDLNPIEFEIFEENYSKEHQRLANLPLVNLSFINKLLEERGFIVPEDLKFKEDLVIFRESDSDEVIIETDSEDEYFISHKNLI